VLDADEDDEVVVAAGCICAPITKGISFVSLRERKKARSEAGEAKVRTAELDVELESEMVLKRSYHMDT